MNKDELLKIKEYALERHIPIIMDDTLEVIDKYLTEKRPEKILEIGTAVGYSAMCFSEYFLTLLRDLIKSNIFALLYFYYIIDFTTNLEFK